MFHTVKEGDEDLVETLVDSVITDSMYVCFGVYNEVLFAVYKELMLKNPQ